MSTSLPLFESLFSGAPAPTGPALTPVELRDSGIQSALDHVLKVKAEYVSECLARIAELKAGTLITSEDLREMAGDPPEGCENSIAGILKRAASRKLIVNTGATRQAKRTSLHAKPLNLWRRL